MRSRLLLSAIQKRTGLPRANVPKHWKRTREPLSANIFLLTAVESCLPRLAQTARERNGPKSRLAIPARARYVFKPFRDLARQDLRTVSTALKVAFSSAKKQSMADMQHASTAPIGPMTFCRSSCTSGGRAGMGSPLNKHSEKIKIPKYKII